MPTIEKTYIFVRKEGGGEEHVYEESGWEPSIVADELTPYTNYRAEGGAIVDGLQATAENRVSFQTLRRNNLTATFNAVRRQGLGTIDEGGWKVYYDYTSLYALSSAILYVSQNGTQVGQYQGVADYNTHQITFGIPANDWVCCGEQYDLHVTVIDIFGQSYTTPVTTITTDVFNSVSMNYASSTTSSVTFDLDYWLDYGFASGWLDVWNEGDDPDVDQPQDHYHFFEGDTQVTADGLEDGTTYIFRVTITLNDGQGTEIYTAYQNASTQIDWSTKYLTVQNEYEGWNTLVLTALSSKTALSSTTYDYSTDDGATWTTVTDTNGNGRRISFSRRILLRHTGAMCTYNSQTYTYYWHTIDCLQPFSVAGNALSLLYGSDYSQSGNTVPTLGLSRVFRGTKVVDAKNLYLGIPFANNSESNFERMFEECAYLKEGPSLPNTALTRLCYHFMFSEDTLLEKFPELPAQQLQEDCYEFIFSGCTGVTTPMASLPSRDIPAGAYAGMFQGCTGLLSTPDLSSAVRVGRYGMSDMFRDCKSLTKGADISNVVQCDIPSFVGMYRGCSELRMAYAPTVSDWTTTVVGDANCQRWLQDVYADGELHANTSIQGNIPTDSVNGCPSGWTVVELS
ncbi:MAG: hypothetical protein IKH15_08060 [Bacteroidales bacterium]|nr:hypothetical protein [Bacteroidales bacterium]MBR4637039.1 hypothetical protein [Bacteroidales bacterium]